MESPFKSPAPLATNVDLPLYSPLSPDNREIRLLHLRPLRKSPSPSLPPAPSSPQAALDYIWQHASTPQSPASPSLSSPPLECTISVVSLDADPEFEAVSYIWGEKDMASLIVNDARRVLITKNLASALTALALPNKERTLWVDAICINQADTAERSEQVRLMSTIFSHATCVLSFLGSRAPERNALAIAASFLQCASAANWSAEWLLSLLMRQKARGALGGPGTAGLRAVAGFAGVLAPWGHEYWQRVWIQQEFVLAKDGFLVAGSMKVPFGFIEKFAGMVAMLRGREDLQGKFHTLLLEVKSQLVPGSECDVKDILALDQVFHGIASTSLIMKRFQIKNDFTRSIPRALPLLDLLENAFLWKATEPRDRIYALLGMSDLAHSRSPGLQVDYSKDLRQVYTGLVPAVIQETGSLKILRFARAGKQPSKKSGHGFMFPTWVPDWMTLPRPLVGDSRWQIDDHGCPPKYRRPSVQVDVAKGILAAKGFRVGRVASVGKVMPATGPTKEIAATLQAWLALFESAYPAHPLPANLFEVTVRRRRTTPLHKDKTLQTKELLQAIVAPSIDTSPKLLEDLRAGNRSATLFTIESCDTAVSRGPVDENFLMGVGRLDVREGDFVVMLMGLPAPVVLRGVKGGDWFEWQGVVWVRNLEYRDRAMRGFGEGRRFKGEKFVIH